jgi:hypothetical protein
MTRAAYEQLLVLLRHAVSDNPPDSQVRRLSKGLVKALTKWLRLTEPLDSVQARSGTPRDDSRLASVNASLASLDRGQR